MSREEFEAIVSGALYDFAGYLTTMDEAYTVGAAHDASRMATEVKGFLEKRDISLADANVMTWHQYEGV